jgi:hypothetical protein
VSAGATQRAGPIAVAGATGYTGRLVARELRRRGREVVLVGRDRDRLRGAAEDVGGGEIRAVARWDRRGLTAALRNCLAVVACAGPFVVAGRPVVEAAIEAGVPYTDSTGEQEFVRLLLEEFDAPARSAGVPLLPACGFDFLPGDLLAALAGEGLGPLARIDVVYAAADPTAVTPGTKKSVAAVVAGGRALVRRDGRLRWERIGAERHAIETSFGRLVAISIPAAEPLVVPLHLEVDTVVTHLALAGPLGRSPLAAAAAAGVLALPGVGRLLAPLLSHGASDPGPGALEAPIACQVDAVSRNGRSRRLLAEGRGAYAVTARSLAGLAGRLGDGAVDLVGVLAPAQAVAPGPFLAEIGFAVRVLGQE